MKINFKYLAAFIILFGIETFIALFVHDQFIRPFVGDILVVILVYTFLRAFISHKLKYLPWGIFAFAVLVELSQLINILKILGLENNRILRVICGTSYDFKDIVCYFIGTVIIFGFEYIISKKRIV